ncbi:hypothetical protein SAMN04487936_101429 [Halobacillus dabanensis]|uniref:Uncharacterized protein n=1 Tax=Halobacillus dabanensis TaxID=240302 RepID=A0A1I3PTD0_HALDA|nr:hypothetical protein [Halobacillus dabanensis]SFJ24491.1 hypothetical protein SAMN04487936_101429 [Halobacillus dabanensis]
MNFQYSNTTIWRKKAIGSLLNTVTSLVPLGLALYLNGRVEKFIVIMTGAIFLLGLWQMVHYMRMPERDYVHLEEGIIDIRIGIADPNTRLSNEEIKHIQQIDDVISLQSDRGEEENIYLENLSNADKESLLTELEYRYGNRMHRSNQSA